MSEPNKVSQFYYTSSKRGYGVYAESPDIKLDEKNQITVNVAYKRPQKLIDTNEKDLSKFPIKITRFKISNHKWVLARSNYLGLDNTGRDGNFFSHVLLFESVDAFNKNYFQFQFKEGLTPEEFEITNPSQLGFVNEPQVNKGELQKFAQKNAKSVPRFIEALFLSLRQKKKLAIVDSNENIYLWIQLLHELVPVNLVKDLEFSTYVERITSGFDIVGIYDEELLRDTSRIIPFGKNDQNIEISDLALNLANDYLNDSPRQLFNIISNSYRRDELLQRLEELYNALATNDVSKEDFLKEVRLLEKSNLDLSKNVLSYLLRNNILGELMIDDFKIIGNFIITAFDTNEFYRFMYQAISQGSYDRVEYLFNNFIDYSLPVSEYFKVEELNEYLQYYIVLDLANRIKKGFNDSLLKDAFERVIQVHMIHPERAKELAKILLRQFLLSFDGRMVYDLAPYSQILKYISPLWSNQDEIKREIEQLLEDATRSNLNKNLISNIIYFSIVINSVKSISRVFSNYQQGRSNDKYLDLLDIYYNSIANLDDDKNVRRDLYVSLEDLYQHEFDRLSHYPQKKFYAQYKLAFQSLPRYKTNYIMIFATVFLSLFLILSGGFIYSSLQPTLTLTLNGQTTNVEWYSNKIIGRVLSVNPSSLRDDADYIRLLLDRINLPEHSFSGYGIDPVQKRVVLSYTSDSNGRIREYFLDIEEIESRSDVSSKPIILIDNEQINEPIVIEFSFTELSADNFENLILSRLNEKDISIEDNLQREILNDEILSALYSKQIEGSTQRVNLLEAEPFRIRLVNLQFTSDSFISNSGFIASGSFDDMRLITNDFAEISSQSVPVHIRINSVPYILNSNNEIFINNANLDYYGELFPYFTGINQSIAIEWMEILFKQYLEDEFNLDPTLINPEFDIDAMVSSFGYEEASYSIPLIEKLIDSSIPFTVDDLVINASGLSADNYLSRLEEEVLVPLNNQIKDHFTNLVITTLGSEFLTLINVEELYSIEFDGLETTLLDESGVLASSGQFELSMRLLNRFSPVPNFINVSFNLTIEPVELPETDNDNPEEDPSLDSTNVD